MKRLLLIFLLSPVFVHGQLIWQWGRADSASGSYTNANSGAAITTDAAGNVYATGSFESSYDNFGAITITHSSAPGLYNTFIAKYNATGNVIWAISPQGSNANNGHTITTDVAGNVYVAGNFYGTITFGDTTLTHAGSGVDGGNMYLAKYDSAGNVIWAVTANSDSDGITGVTTDEAANVYVAGSFAGGTLKLGGITITNPGVTGANNIFIAKYDPAGNVLWVRSAAAAGSNAEASTTGIKTDAYGHVYVSGFYAGATITFDTTTLTDTGAAGTNDIFIAKYDTAGNFIWVRGAAGSSDDFTSAVTTDVVGNAYLSGYYSSPTLNFGGVTITNASGGSVTDIFIAKYDTAGNVIWASTYGSGNAGALGITTSDSGYIYMTGYFAGAAIAFGTDTLANAGGDDIFVTKLDTAGNVLWAMRAGGAGGELAYGITTSPGSNVYVTGYFSSPVIPFGTTTATKTGIVDVFIAKITVLGLITGDLMVCTGDSIMLSDAASGGVWSSGDTAVATVNAASGSVAGVAAGTAVITYAVDTDYVTRVVTVNPSPSAIMGNDGFCWCDSTMLGDSILGGTWSSIDSPDVVVGIATGIVKVGTYTGIDSTIITYTLPTGCYVSKVVYVYTLCNDGVPTVANNNTITIYPNPVSDELTIESSSEPISEISITNVMGQVEASPRPSPKEREVLSVDVSGFAPGVYFVKINRVVRKFVKE